MTDHHEALRETAREFTQREVVPHLQDWEDAGEMPRSLHLAAAKQGLLGVAFPLEAGGSSGLLAGLFTGGIALPHIVASGNQDLIERFVRPTLAGEKIGALAVTEPGGGSDVAGITTRAVRDGDD